ncbi:MAG: prenyltransferase/squalene oxidase repeat-containing protein [Pirellulaceae bacterium]
MIDQQRLLRAYEKVRFDLLSEREPQGHWIGELATSALSTATAVSALTLVERHGLTDAKSGTFANERRESQLSELIVGGLHWLADHQNPDGGWGDTELSYSNIATTMLVTAAFRLTGVPADHADLMQRAEEYIERTGGVPALRRRYGRDKTFAVPILTNCALAGIVPWREVSALPFEAACLPQEFYRFAQLPVVSYAIPALVAIGQAKYFHQPPWNPLTRMIRAASVGRSLRVLRRMQPSSGGYLEAVPLTSFVVMSLAATGRAAHRVTQRGVKFLIDSVRPDGSWPIDTNLATWNTTLALNALAGGGEDIAELDCLDWLLSCQHRQRHPFTGAAPGGWGWSDLSGAVPDSDDTPGALLTLAAWRDSPSCRKDDVERIESAAEMGVGWLLGLQNRDGGWPTFCRGWGKLPFDRSGADLTAHVLRALHVWRDLSGVPKSLPAAMQRGLRYLEKSQRDDGSWVPLWFGNQDHPQEENPVYGTSKVLLAYRDLDLLDTTPAQRGFHWLTESQNRDGGWGGGRPLAAWKTASKTETAASIVSSVEETALALEALLAAKDSPSARKCVETGLRRLVEAVESDQYRENSPIGFYFAKLWYHELLYPRIFTLSALGQALRGSHPSTLSQGAQPQAARPQAQAPRLTNA